MLKFKKKHKQIQTFTLKKKNEGQDILKINADNTLSEIAKIVSAPGGLSNERSEEKNERQEEQEINDMSANTFSENSALFDGPSDVNDQNEVGSEVF